MGEKTTIDSKINACDEAGGFGAGEKDDGAGQFVSRAEALHWSVVEDALGARSRGAIFLEKQASVLFRGKEAGGEGVDSHSMRSPLAGKELGEVEDRGFGGRVSDDAAERQMRGDTGDVNDAALLAFDHFPAKDLAGEEGAADEIEIEGFAPGGEVEAGEGVLRGNGDIWGVASGGIDQNGRRTKLGGDSRVEVLHTGWIGGVNREKGGCASALADGFDTFPSFFSTASSDGDRCPGGGQGLGHFASEDTGAANHNCHLTGQIKQRKALHKATRIKCLCLAGQQGNQLETERWFLRGKRRRVEKWLTSEGGCHTEYGMKMTMHIDEVLLKRVMEAYGCVTKTDAVEMALKEMDRRKRFKAYIAKPSGLTAEELKSGVEPGYDVMALRAAETPPVYKTKTDARKRSRR